MTVPGEPLPLLNDPSPHETVHPVTVSSPGSVMSMSTENVAPGATALGARTMTVGSVSMTVSVVLSATEVDPSSTWRAIG